MNNSKLKYILIVLSETLFLIALGIVLYTINTHFALELVIYLLLAPAILWLSKIAYNAFDKSLKPVVVIMFILLVGFYIAIIIVKETVGVSCFEAMAYEYLMGSLSLNGFLGAAKCCNKNQTAKVLKFIGVILFFASILMGILALFGIAN